MLIANMFADALYYVRLWLTEIAQTTRRMLTATTLLQRFYLASFLLCGFVFYVLG